MNIKPGARKNLIEHQIHNRDNLNFLLVNTASLFEKVDFIYIDPVGSSKSLAGFENPLVWSKWLKPRLKAAIDSLKPTGVFTVSANDTYLPYLRLAMDEIFGVDNFIGMVVIDTGNVHNNARFLSVSHDYLLVYAKNLNQLTRSDIRWRTEREGITGLRKKEAQLRKQYKDDYSEMTSAMKTWLKEQDVPKRLKAFYTIDAKGVHSYSDLSAPGIRLTYDVLHPVTRKPVTLPSRGWGLSEESFQQLIDQDLIIWGETEQAQPLKKLYLKDTPDQVIRGVLHLPSRTPGQLLKKILGNDVKFDSPKPLEFVKYLIDVMTPDDALVLDFFAGSGTTGHAVLDLNYENENSSRKFILVENDSDVFGSILKPRLEAVINGRWVDGLHRARRAVLKTNSSGSVRPIKAVRAK